MSSRNVASSSSRRKPPAIQSGDRPVYSKRTQVEAFVVVRVRGCRVGGASIHWTCARPPFPKILPNHYAAMRHTKEEGKEEEEKGGKTMTMRMGVMMHGACGAVGVAACAT